MPPNAKAGSASSAPPPHQHGVKGVYYGGHWLDLEDCHGTFTGVDDKCSGCTNHNVNSSSKKQPPCPRSRSSSRPSTSSNGGVDYDVCIIGAGCIGAAIARELSRYSLRVIWLEAADDVSQGATKGNSGIVHAGYDDEPGTNRAKYCWKGNQMFPQLDKELRFGYQLNGSMVLATNNNNDEERAELERLLERGKINGVERLRILEQDEIRQMEPHVNDNVVAALYSPDAGNVIPYVRMYRCMYVYMYYPKMHCVCVCLQEQKIEAQPPCHLTFLHALLFLVSFLVLLWRKEYAIALAENAVDNGVELRIRRQVTSINKDDGAEDGCMEIKVNHWEPKPYVDSVEKATTAATAAQGGGLDLTRIGTLGGILSVVAFSSGQVDMSYLPIAIGVTLGMFLYQIVFGRFQGGGRGGAGQVVSKSTPLQDLVAKAGSVEGTGGTPVDVEDMKIGGSGSPKIVEGVTVEEETIRAKYILNCAGGASDQIAKMIGDNSFTIKPRLGDYLLLNRNQGHLAKHTLFPCPDPVLGKGVLVQVSRLLFD